MAEAKTVVGTREELAESAQALIPAIRARADETEGLRRLPDDTLNEFRVAGLNRVLQPAVFGGAEAHFGGLVDVISTVAGACASTG